MNRKLANSIVVIGIWTCFFFLFGETGSVWSVENTNKMTAERPIFMGDIDGFEELERPPVEFYHDKHTIALKKEGCGACHPQGESDNFIFRYPKLIDDRTEQGLMNAYHESCVGCHREISKAGRKSGFVTCGECHVSKGTSKEYEYVPIGPDYYLHLEDTYHTNCLLCHKEGEEHVEGDAVSLDWKDFYLKRREEEKATWPKGGFDHYLHDKHEKVLQGRCRDCHHTYNEEKGKLVYEEGTESSCRDCHGNKDEGKVLSFRNAAHMSCIDCHMQLEKVSEKGGPLECGECHVEGKTRSRKEMTDIPRPDRGQPERVIISIENARMKSVPFDHKSHEAQTPSCRTCHHEELTACKECHTEMGSIKGGGINLARAYHEVSSERSCVGCHESEKKASFCAGCHQSMEGGLTKSSCLTCHTGPSVKRDFPKVNYDPDDLLPENLPEEMSLNVLEKDYMPAKFPHRAIIKKLNDISNNNELADFFHKDQSTVCSGCHHYSPMEQKKQVPRCSTCHSIKKEPRTTSIPSLLGAYHRQCLGCHKDMGIEPVGCAGCHAEKKVTKAEAGKE